MCHAERKIECKSSAVSALTRCCWKPPDIPVPDISPAAHITEACTLDVAHQPPEAAKWPRVCCTDGDVLRLQRTQHRTHQVGHLHLVRPSRHCSAGGNIRLCSTTGVCWHAVLLVVLQTAAVRGVHRQQSNGVTRSRGWRTVMPAI
jgi:hypothetical protein